MFYRYGVVLINGHIGRIIKQLTVRIDYPYLGLGKGVDGLKLVPNIIRLEG